MIITTVKNRFEMLQVLVISTSLQNKDSHPGLNGSMTNLIYDVNKYSKHIQKHLFKHVLLQDVCMLALGQAIHAQNQWMV